MNSNISKVGKSFVVGISGVELLSEEEKLLKEIRPLGIILFAKNIDKSSPLKWQRKLRDLITKIKDVCENDDLIVSIDHEGGKVHRFISPITKFKAAKYWREDTELVVKVMACELKELGINLSYAPVLDIHSEESNPVIGERAFSTKVEEVINFASMTQKAFSEIGILCCGKHFPGHGATTVDSHFELPKLILSKEIINSRELLPFKALISQKIPMLMTAHIVLTAFDSDKPATMSKAIINNVLRNELFYNGVVITDDLEMQALNKFSLPQKAINCLEVGVDVLLEAFPTNGELPLKNAYEMCKSVIDALENLKLSEQIYLDSQRRIDNLLQLLKDNRKINDSFDFVTAKSSIKELIIA